MLSVQAKTKVAVKSHQLCRAVDILLFFEKK